MNLKNLGNRLSFTADLYSNYELAGRLFAIVYAIVVWGDTIKYNLIETKNLTTTIVITILILVIFFLLWEECKQRTYLNLTNPYILIKKKLVECYIKKHNNKGFYINEKFTIKALKDGIVDSFRFTIHTPKLKEIQLKNKDAELVSRTVPSGKTENIIVFNKLKKKNNREDSLEKELNLSWEFDDNNDEPIQRYFNHCRGCEELSFAVYFLKTKLPKRVFYLRTPIDDSVPDDEPNDIDGEDAGENYKKYACEFLKKDLDTNHKYLVKWEW